MENHPFCKRSIRNPLSCFSNCHVSFRGCLFLGVMCFTWLSLNKSGVGGLWDVLVYVFHYGSWRWFRALPPYNRKFGIAKKIRKDRTLQVAFWVVVSNIVYFHLYLGKIPILTNIFQMGWNHQLAFILFSFLIFVPGIKSTIPRCSMYGLFFSYIHLGCLEAKCTYIHHTLSVWHWNHLQYENLSSKSSIHASKSWLIPSLKLT